MLEVPKEGEKGEEETYHQDQPVQEFSVRSMGGQKGVVRGSEDRRMKRTELDEMRVPSRFKVAWTSSDSPICLYSYSFGFLPIPEDRQYRKFGLFLNVPLPAEAEALEVDLHLAHGRIVKTSLVPSGTVMFDKDVIVLGEKFQEMWLKIILDRSEFFSDFVPLGKKDSYLASSLSTFYLLLPTTPHDFGDGVSVDWMTVRRCLSSPIFRSTADSAELIPSHVGSTLELVEGPVSIDDILDSLVYYRQKKAFYSIDGIVPRTNAACGSKSSKTKAYMKQLLYPEQPLLKAKRLFSLHNLLQNRLQGIIEVREQKEHFEDIPPELCLLKIIGFSKDIGNSLSLLPSFMHRLENFLVAIDLKDLLSASFPEGYEVTATRVLEALTTEKCLERSSLERLEVLGDAFLKYAVGRHNFLSEEALNEGQLTIRRASTVNNHHLCDLAVQKGLQVYIRDEQFNPSQFFALGRPCRVFCNKDTESTIHREQGGHEKVGGAESCDVKCSRSHHLLHWKTIADAVEALTGAFLVDSGFKAAIAFLQWVGIQVNFKLSDVYRLYEESKSNLSHINNTDVAAIEQLLGYRFHHKGLLVQAFTHPSSKKHSGGCYQRLEFLGDAVLEYLITSYLYSVYPDLKPGQLTDLRSIAVNNVSFGHIAVRQSFHLYLIKNNSNLTEAITKFQSFIHTPDSEKDLLEEPACPKVLGDIVESCVGAVLLDAGFDLKLVWKIMLSLLDPALSFSTLQINPIRELRELCECCTFQKDPVKGNGPYMVTVEASVKGTCITCKAFNPNSNAAARMAAQMALSKLKDRGKQSHKSLEDIVRSTRKKEAQLIGFDEKAIVFDSTVLSQPGELCLGNLEVEELSPQNAVVSLNADGSSISTWDPCKEPSVPSESAESHEMESNEESDVDHDQQIPVERCQAGIYFSSEDENAKKYTGGNSEVASSIKLSSIKFCPQNAVVSLNGDGSSISTRNPCKEPSFPSESAESHEMESNEEIDVHHGQEILIERCQADIYFSSEDENAKKNTGGNEEVASSPKLSPQNDVVSLKADGNSISTRDPCKEPSVPSESAESHEIQSNEASKVDHGQQTPVLASEDENAKKNTGVLGTVSAKSRLFEICSANYWRPPLYTCCKEDGPSHLKSVTIEVESASRTTVECFSEPLLNKKAAKEHAAEGALWYLKHQGFLS